MNIPPKYEDVVAKLDASLGREADLIASANQNKLMMDAACGEIAGLQEELANFELVQQRLTVAEQRAAVMEKALSRIAREHDCGCSPCTGSCTSQVALEITVDAMRDIAIAALKQADGEVS